MEGGDKCRKTRQDVKLMFFTLIPHLFPPKSGMLITPGLCWWRPEREGAGGWGAAKVSHGEGDEAVVSLDVPLQDLWTQSQHAFKADPVQLHAFEGTPSDDGGCPGAVQQQGDLTWGGGSAALMKVPLLKNAFPDSIKVKSFHNASNIALTRLYTLSYHTGFPLMFIYSTL